MATRSSITSQNVRGQSIFGKRLVIKETMSENKCRYVDKPLVMQHLVVKGDLLS